MADSSKGLQLRELKDMINDLKKMIKTHKRTKKWRIICFRICQKILILRRSEEVI